MTSSEGPIRPVYVYLQRPDSGMWVTVGRYIKNSPTSGLFRYSPSYIASGVGIEIDPVNCRLIPELDFSASRYHGLHDVLRDACPDAWGKSLIAKQSGIPMNSPDIEFLLRSGNGDRWGALAVGASKTPGASHLSSPKLTQLDDLVLELIAIVENKAPINPLLRKRLFASASSGGARPKLTVQDGPLFWLVKPGIATDTVDLALLEHFTQLWGCCSGLSFAQTAHHRLSNGRSVVRILRFDRHGRQRTLCVSAASLLQVSYPPLTQADSAGASYPRLADTLKSIGSPLEDRIELFGRMVFNAIVGNDDDHVRNHAIRYDAPSGLWRLAPAFDVVPNPEETPSRLAMQVCAGKSEISRDNFTADFSRFGFVSETECSTFLDQLMRKIESTFNDLHHLLTEDLRHLLADRVHENLNKLSIKPKSVGTFHRRKR